MLLKILLPISIALSLFFWFALYKFLNKRKSGAEFYRMGGRIIFQEIKLFDENGKEKPNKDPNVRSRRYKTTDNNIFDTLNRAYNHQKQVYKLFKKQNIINKKIEEIE